jgi:hypothetical protein
LEWVERVARGVAEEVTVVRGRLMTGVETVRRGRRRVRKVVVDFIMWGGKVLALVKVLTVKKRMRKR